MTVGLCALARVVRAAPAAQAAFDDPLFVFTPSIAARRASPPPAGHFEGPCGLAVDDDGRFYVSDYYHHTVDVFSPIGAYAYDGSVGYLGQLAGIDPLDGPCGLALDSADTSTSTTSTATSSASAPTLDPGPGTTIAGAGIDAANPPALP